jgi:hypothetical protein
VSELVVSADAEHKKRRKRQRRPRVALSPELERYRKISVREAAAIKGISIDGFRRHYRHLIDQVTPRRQTVTLSKVIDGA